MNQSLPQNPEIDDVRIRIHMIRDAPNVNERWNLMKGVVSEFWQQSSNDVFSTDAMAELTNRWVDFSTGSFQTRIIDD